MQYSKPCLERMALQGLMRPCSVQPDQDKCQDVIIIVT